MKTFNYLAVATLFVFWSTVNAAEGFYFGGGIGYSSFDDDMVAVKLDSDIGFRGFVGYDFTDNFGIELDYARLGEPDVTNAGGATIGTIDVNAYSAVAVGRYPFTETLDAFIKLGAAKVKAESEFSVGGVNANTSNDDSGFTFGVGGRYLFDQIQLSAEWQRYDSDVDLFSLGIGFHF